MSPQKRSCKLTIKIPAPSIGDKILRLLGKKRALIIPKGPFEGMGLDAYAYAVKESFWSALLRPCGSKLPSGAVDYETVRKEVNEIRSV